MSTATKHPPQPADSHPILGQIPGYRKDTLSYEKHLARTYGDVVDIRWFNRHGYLISNPEDVRKVLVDEADKFDKAPIYKQLLNYFLGNGLLTSDGAFWKRQRGLSQPAFHHKRIVAYAQTMVDYTQRQLIEWQPGTVRDINKDMMRLTLSIVAKTLFNADIEKDANRIGDALTDVLEITNDRMKSPIQVIPDWLPTPGNRKRKAAVDALNNIVMGIIDQRRANPEDQGDLLSMLMMARDEDGNGMTDIQLRDEAVTLVLAGHETTANALSWTWYLLSQHPEVEAKLHEELDRVLGGRLPTPADFRQLEYTEMVIKEVMRLYPPIPSIGRLAKEETTLGGYTVPKDMIIMISPHVIHRDARWFPEPDAFRPERFTKENEKALPKCAYLSFSTGPRVCIGNSFAMMESTLILATIAQQYRLNLVPGQTVTPYATLTLRPADDLKMQLEPRPGILAPTFTPTELALAPMA
jgi:cytochrome P450